MSDNLMDDLRQFTGTENWYRHHIIREVTYTDGVKAFAEKAGAWWFVDDCIIEYDPLQSKHGFLTIFLDVTDNNTASITVDDGNDNVLATKHIPFTDCPAGQFKFYFTNDVFLLPSEY